MNRMSGESAEIRNLHDKISQLNQQISKLTDEKVAKSLLSNPKSEMACLMSLATPKFLLKSPPFYLALS